MTYYRPNRPKSAFILHFGRPPASLPSLPTARFSAVPQSAGQFPGQGRNRPTCRFRHFENIGRFASDLWIHPYFTRNPSYRQKAHSAFQPGENPHCGRSGVAFGSHSFPISANVLILDSIILPSLSGPTLSRKFAFLLWALIM